MNNSILTHAITKIDRDLQHAQRELDHCRKLVADIRQRADRADAALVRTGQGSYTQDYIPEPMGIKAWVLSWFK